ncbi:MAG: endonuclease/exonuclease/phosphatase [Chloroflexi bacterium]|nr:endonuclease/exonuclease/phosphatase [Chloroflexota bacterium]MBI1856517.1 endonuclease/exonuclease/phosphatase [Chloroflexota bacterium]MBI3340079.1 endonuclease/exonuclease/phosphatase [Chloroflexota bacterium]
MSTQYHFAFWNLENLFDIEGSPRREEKVARVIGSDIKGWTQALLDKKISQLSSIIRQMNSSRGPDLLGISEAENRFVVDLLAQSLAPLGRNYQVIHHDSPDRRGIDIAFIYDGNLLEVPEPLADNVFSHFVLRRTATRDILQVTFKTKAHQRELIVMGNHWPSRSGGEAESDAYRAMAGETLAYFHERVLEVKGDAAAVIAMGDFNDEPFNTSIVDYALGLRAADLVVKGRNPYFLNLMWALMGKGLGTFYFNGPNLLDQFLVNKNWLKSDSVFKIKPDSVAIVKFPAMMDKKGQPIPFGGMGKPVNQKGFSDHFPVEVIVTEAD